MSGLAIEIADTGIVAVDESGLLGTPSPGYALLEGHTFLVGQEAFEVARLKPRRVTSRFWERLDSTPLPRPLPRHLSWADLVHAHLSEIWRTVGQLRSTEASRAEMAAVLLAVPGSFSSDQLGLLLGISRSCGIPVVGMVDAATAAVASHLPEDRVLHVDLQLHRLVVTELGREPAIVRRRVKVSEHVGLHGLRDIWAKAIAELFIRQTRFDPLHSATSEQQLYDHLSRWLARLDDEGQVAVHVEVAGKERTVELTRDLVMAAAGSHYEQITELVRTLGTGDETASILLSRAAAELPGLAGQLASSIDCEVRGLPLAAAAVGALRYREHIVAPGEELPMVTRLPLPGARERRSDGSAANSERLSDRDSRPQPTHLLYKGTAHAITEEAFWVGTSLPAAHRGLELRGSSSGDSESHCSVRRAEGRVIVEAHGSSGTFVNGEKVTGATELRVGDQLRVGEAGVEIQVIAVGDSHGQTAS